MDLSIVIVTYNSKRLITECLHSVERAARGIEHEILAVDNDSEDGTQALLKEFGGTVTFLENSENRGFARAANRGLERSSGEFILFLNPDTVIQSDSLHPLLTFMREHSRVGICGCKLLNSDGSLQYSKGSFPNLLSTLWRMILPRRMRKYHFRGYDKIGPCDWVTGAFMVVRSRMAKGYGGFDEGYFMYYEDVDYCLQAKEREWMTYYYPGVAAVHHHPHAISPKNLSVEKEIQRSRLYFFKKNRSILSYALLRALTWMVNHPVVLRAT